MVKAELDAILKLSWAFLVSASQHESPTWQPDSSLSDLGTSSKSNFNEEMQTLAYDRGVWSSMIEVIERKL